MKNVLLDVPKLNDKHLYELGMRISNFIMEKDKYLK